MDFNSYNFPPNHFTLRELLEQHGEHLLVSILANPVSELGEQDVARSLTSEAAGPGNLPVPVQQQRKSSITWNTPQMLQQLSLSICKQQDKAYVHAQLGDRETSRTREYNLNSVTQALA